MTAQQRAQQQKLRKIFSWISEHDHVTVLKSDHVLVGIDYREANGKQGIDYYEVTTWQQAREVLGY